MVSEPGVHLQLHEPVAGCIVYMILQYKCLTVNTFETPCGNVLTVYRIVDEKPLWAWASSSPLPGEQGGSSPQPTTHISVYLHLGIYISIYLTIRLYNIFPSSAYLNIYTVYIYANLKFVIDTYTHITLHTLTHTDYNTYTHITLHKHSHYTDYYT